MRTTSVLLTLLALAVPGLARAQLATRSISLESGLSVPLARGATPAVPVAIAAGAWLEGDVEAVARVSYASVARPPVRGADGGAVDLTGGTLGLRWAPGADALRPELLVEAGWETFRGTGGARSAFALAAGGGVEWFFHRDLSVRVRAEGRRGAIPGWRLDACLGVAAYF